MASTNYEYAHIHNPDYYQDQAVAESIKDHLDMLGVIYADVTKKRSAIEINSGLTAEGKSVARKELIIEIKEARRGWLDRLSPLDRQIESIEKQMILTSHRPDDVVGALREMEMRSEIRKMDPLDLEAAYKNAAKNGDDLFVNSVENSPIPFVFDKKADLVESVKSARLARRFPEQSVKIKDLNLGLQNLQSALRSVESNLRAMGLEIAADPVSDRAGLRVV